MYKKKLTAYGRCIVDEDDPMPIMNHMIQTFPHFIVVKMEKYLYKYSNTGVIRLRDKYIALAINSNRPLVIRCPDGEKVFFGKQIKLEGKKVKEEFLIKGVPMTLFELIIPDGIKQPIEKYMY